jgi:hypothetical protein
VGDIPDVPPPPAAPAPAAPAPELPALERTFPPVRLHDERKGTKIKANTKRMRPSLAERFIFIVFPQEVEYFHACNYLIWLIAKIDIFCQTKPLSSCCGPNR